MTELATPLPARPGSTSLAGGLPGLLLRHAESTPKNVALRHNELSRWRELTWDEYATRTAHIGLGLSSLGVGPGDRVAIHSENRPEWVMTDLAAQGIGAATVGIYPTSPAS